MQNFKQFLTESTVNANEVRTAIVYYINDSLLESGVKQATIKIGKTRIQNVVAAKPSTRPSTGGVSPYVDIELVLTNNSKVNVGVRVAKSKKFFLYRNKQLRGAAVPALFQGIHSLDKMYPEVREHYLSSILEYYRDKGYEHGAHLPVVYGRIEGEMKRKILLGDSKHGGVVDYIFAIDRVPHRYKKYRIPTMNRGYTKNEYLIEIGNARAFNSSEILSNNDVYIWATPRNDRLYLGNDRTDMNNLPVVFGPPSGEEKEYGVKRYRVGMNVDSKDIVGVKDNHRIFKLELKNPRDLVKSDSPEQQKELPVGTGRRTHPSIEQNRSEYGETLSPDERESLIDTIVDNAERGMKHKYKIDLDREQLEHIRNSIEDLDDINLKRMSTTPSHRLASEIKKDYI